MQRKTEAQKKKLGKLLAEGTAVCTALEQAGWSPTQARKGWESVPNDVIATLPKKAHRLISLDKTDRETRKNLIRGRLVDNITKGKDGGSQSAKILGSDSDLNMWTPDQQLGVLVLNAPKELLERKAELLGTDYSSQWDHPKDEPLGDSTAEKS